MNKWIQMAVAALASGLVQFGLLVGTGVTGTLPLLAGVAGAVGASLLALLKQLPREEWTEAQRRDELGFVRFGLLPWLACAAVAALLMTGCGSPMAKPENPAQAAIYAQKLADSAEAWSTQMLNERLIHSSQGRQVQAAAREVREAAVLTRKLYAANPQMPKDALSALQAADQALRFLEQFLLDQGQPLPPKESP